MTARVVLLLAAALAGPAAARTKPAPPAPPAAVAAPTPAPPALLAAIDAALASGQTGTARTLIEQARGTHEGPELALRVAETLLAAGSLPDAAAAFLQVSAVPGFEARGNQGLGLAYLRLDRDAEAAAALDTALARDPTLVRAWLARGVAADRRRDWPGAAAAYDKALALDPASAPALTNRGYSRLLQGRYADAEADLARAATLDPKLAAAATNLRLARAMQGRYEQAFAGSKRGDLARDLNTVGFAAMTRGDYPVAQAYFTRALKLNTEFDRVAWANLRYLQQIDRGPAAAAVDGQN